MKKWVIYLLSCIMIFMTLPFGSAAFADGGGAKPYGIGIGIGDYIQLGKYYDEPILWRYVADDENGKLILSDKVICEKIYDIYLGRKRGSHISRYNRDAYSNRSNYWGDSNIRSWLNSKAPEGKVDWLCGNPPIYEPNIDYYNEKGFLADGNFTQSERMVIKKVKQKSLLDATDSEYAVGGDVEGWGSSFENINYFVVNNYDNICYEYIDDMMFLLDMKQLYNIMQNSALLGDKYFIANITAQAKENSGAYKHLLKESQNNDDYKEVAERLFSRTTSQYYLRTPFGYGSMHADSPFSYHVIKSGGEVFAVSDEADADGSIQLQQYATTNTIGIRPAFYLNEKTARILSGSGTEDDPYVLTGKPNTKNMEDGAIGAAENPRPFGISIYVNDRNPWFVDEPFIENDRVYVSLAWAVHELYTYYKYDDLDYVTLEYPYKEDSYIAVQPGSNIVTTNSGEQIEWDVAPQIANGILYLPLRAMAETFDAKVEWIEDEQKVVITK